MCLLLGGCVYYFLVGVGGGRAALCQLVFGDHQVIGDVCVGVLRQVVAASRSSVMVMVSPHAGHSPPVPMRRA